VRRTYLFLLFLLGGLFFSAVTHAEEHAAKCWLASTMRTTEEHQYGEELIVWFSGELRGHIVASCGLAGEPVQGEITNIRLSSKLLAFDFKYINGVKFDRETPNGTPAKFAGSFSGEKGKDKFSGILHFDDGQSCEQGKNIQIAMKVVRCSELPLYLKDRVYGNK